MPDRAAGRPEQRGPTAGSEKEGDSADSREKEGGKTRRDREGEGDATTTIRGTPPPWDLPSFTAAEIRGPTLLIYRYLDTYTLTGVVF